MSQQNRTQYLSNLSHAVINNPTITHFTGGNTIFSHQDGSSGMKLLLENISEDAFHDAAKRGDPPKCHFHTRLALRAEIMEWVKSPEARLKQVFWISGPPEAGKTAIGQSIAEECKKLGLLAASYFFSHRATGRNETTQLVATIAYQISRFLPHVEEHLCSIIAQDRTIFSRNLSTQMQVLVIDPLKALSSSTKPVFVILDGINDIGPSPQSPVDVLNVVEMATRELKHIRFIFLITSRPEEKICQAFKQPYLMSITEGRPVEGNYKLDIKIGHKFTSAFQEIREKYIQLGIDLPSPWPTEGPIEQLVLRASGQSIYADTVIEYIDSSRHDPVNKLNSILALPAPGNETTTLLDALYRFILSSVVAPSLPSVLDIFSVIMLANSYREDEKHAPVLTELLTVNVHTALMDIHALVFVPPTDANNIPLAFRDPDSSFYDFLVEKTRSREYHIGVDQGHITLSRCWLKVAANFKAYDKFSLEDALSAFIYHCQKSPVSKEIADDLASFDLRRCLRNVGAGLYNVRSIAWENFFGCAQQQGGNRNDISPRLKHDFDDVVLQSLSRYPSPLQTYIPTIMIHAGVFRSGRAEMTRILLEFSNLSPTEVRESLRLDSELLNIYHPPRSGISDIFLSLFQDPSRAGQHTVDDGSYLALAKRMVGIIFPEEDDTEDNSPHLDMLNFDFTWFSGMLSETPTDKDLAQTLSQRAFQYVRSVRGRYNIAMGSMEYVERCGIPFLKHTHLPGTDTCIVCDQYDDASVVNNSGCIVQ